MLWILRIALFVGISALVNNDSPLYPLITCAINILRRGHLWLSRKQIVCSSTHFSKFNFPQFFRVSQIFRYIYLHNFSKLAKTTKARLCKNTQCKCNSSTRLSRYNLCTVSEFPFRAFLRFDGFASVETESTANKFLDLA